MNQLKLFLLSVVFSFCLLGNTASAENSLPTPSVDQLVGTLQVSEELLVSASNQILVDMNNPFTQENTVNTSDETNWLKLMLVMLFFVCPIFWLNL